VQYSPPLRCVHGNEDEIADASTWATTPRSQLASSPNLHRRTTTVPIASVHLLLVSNAHAQIFALLFDVTNASWAMAVEAVKRALDSLQPVRADFKQAYHHRPTEQYWAHRTYALRCDADFLVLRWRQLIWGQTRPYNTKNGKNL